ncbi:hypothetical protein BH11BAC4_BH11BAC4_04200 [soil metagenome]
MKLFLLLLLSLFNQHLSAQLLTKVKWTEHSSMPASDVIYYNPDNKLVWENFRGKPGDASRVAAITMSGFGYNASMRSSGQKGQLDVKVYCFFNKNNSWVRAGKKTDYILTHEQHHFDVSYIAANIFVDKIQSATITTSNYNFILSRIYNECIDIMNKMQDDYDNQTRNGQEKEIQEKWNKFIDTKIDLITK